MTSTMIKTNCIRCNKGGGTAMCYGCENAFCTKHFIEHRQELLLKLDDIGMEHNILRKDLMNENSIHPLVVHINQWEQESIIKIQTAAKSARIDLEKMINHIQIDLKESMNKMSEELQSHREADDYTELDIKKWIDQLQAFRRTLDSPININIDYENDSKTAIHLIKINKQQSFDISNQILQSSSQIFGNLKNYDGERFMETFGNIELSKDGLLAWCLSDVANSVVASGIGRYSSGIHIIRIRIERSHAHYPFLGILNSSEKINKTNVLQSTSCNGWWDFNYRIINGQISDNYSKNIIQQGDEVMFILDCDNGDLRLEHPRTRNIETISINLRLCSFPWKIFVLLRGKDNRVRILR